MGISGKQPYIYDGENQSLGLEAVMPWKKSAQSAVLIYRTPIQPHTAALTAAKNADSNRASKRSPRSHSLETPKKSNRVAIDHRNRYCEKQQNQGFRQQKKASRDGTFLVGDPMYDAFLHYGGNVDSKRFVGVGFNQWKFD